MSHPGYAAALRDWLACAVGGAREPAAVAAREVADGLPGRVAAAGTAGHVLDFDDTYAPGLAHVSAPVAPAAVLLGAELGASVGEVLSAFAAGWEAMAALSAANHPALRERGWHPTSVCGVVGSATAAAELLGADPAASRRLSLLAAAGLRGAFGSDGKSLQVGAAAAAGVQAARLAAAGARARAAVERDFEEAYGAVWAEPAAPAIGQNWIKAHPCCLQTHSAIDAAAEVGGLPIGAAGEASVALAAELEVVVHPISLATASIAEPADGLEAKFSIPYLTAYTLLRGAPTVESFRSLDREVAEVARRVRTAGDESLLESEALLCCDGETLAHVRAAAGSPENPMSDARLAAKERALAGDRLSGLLDDPSRPAADLAEVLA